MKGVITSRSDGMGNWVKVVLKANIHIMFFDW
jgi:hypothetical protein